MTLAQSFSVDWFTQDPTGLIVAGSVVVVVGIIVLWMLIRMMKWAVGYRKELMLGAIVLGGAVWGLQFVNMNFQTWLIVGFIAFGMFLGWALYLTHK